MFKKFLATMVLVSWAFSSNAALITGLYSTGFGETGQELSVGDDDPNYLINGNETFLLNPNDAWVANSSNSKWIWVDGEQNPNSTFEFVLTFDLTGFNPESVMIGGRTLADNSLKDILLNDVSTGITGSGFKVANWNEYTIDSGFASGLNTLTFKVGNTNGPGAFRNEFTSVDAKVPAPASATLTLLGLALLCMRKLHKK